MKVILFLFICFYIRINETALQESRSNLVGFLLKSTFNNYLSLRACKLIPAGKCLNFYKNTKTKKGFVWEMGLGRMNITRMKWKSNNLICLDKIVMKKSAKILMCKRP